ncbi:MAG: aspartate/glutamate racemase family protein [Clostridiales bacterium]|nr:aspartate/glutamate racemase family protein [Clostridiales bacterium]
MKTIGLLGGMSWESTVTYYRVINEVIKEKLAGFHSAKVLLYSVDFAEIEKCQASEMWDEAAEILASAAKGLERGGADFLIICTNTMHKVADKIQEAITIPIIHIAEATADELKKHGIKKTALLGTKYTMKQAFYKDKIKSNGIEVIVPNERDMELINNVIYNELCLGIISEKSKKELLRVIKELEDAGAQGVILGCTEIGLLISQKDTSLPVFDTTRIHAKRAAIQSLD